MGHVACLIFAEAHCTLQQIAGDTRASSLIACVSFVTKVGGLESPADARNGERGSRNYL